ncbi:hypothetical protein QQP08_019432 [Theobroma cacao]|nr:hypothetical protein QQP08_019432 [Theobroma cacao]
MSGTTTAKARLKNLLSQTDNRHCADCAAPDPKWALKHMMGRQRLKTTSHEGDHLSCPYAYQGLQDQLAKGPLGPFTILGDMWCSEQVSHALDIKE